MEKIPSWHRQLTTKMYLHPPKSESIVTIWPDFKILMSHLDPDTWLDPQAHGFILLDGETRQPVLWRDSKWHVRDDGAPLHRLENRSGDSIYEMEAFCLGGPSPRICTRLVVRRSQADMKRGRVILLPRSGKESLMISYAGDGYNSYDPRVEIWGMIRNGWAPVEGGLVNGDYSISVQPCGPAKLNWSDGGSQARLHERHCLLIDFEFDAEGCFQLDLLLQRGDVGGFDLDEERRKAETFWAKELGRITETPKFEAPEYRRMFLHLTVQMLQMIVCHRGGAHTAVIQGVTNRGIWPTEAVEFLVALDRIGIHSYPGEVYDYLCSRQICDGEDRGRIPSLLAPNWANNTGGVLWGLSQHLVFQNDRAAFERFREPMREGYLWIKRTREKTLSGEYPGNGLFPPMMGTDWHGCVAQSWCWTDAWNIMGVEQYCRLLEHFADPEKEAVSSELRAYRAIMDRELRKVVAGKEKAEEIMIPNRLGDSPSDPPPGPYFADGPSNLIRMGLISPGSQTLRQVENYFRNRGLMARGLCGLMTDSLLVNGVNADYWAGHTWYTTLSEMPWFFAWLENGSFEKAEETFLALARYAMTSEYCLSERYADNDPAFAPWQPNASAAGRFVMMMFAYFEARAIRKRSAK